MKAPAVHLRRGEFISACGHKTQNLTKDQSAVTCKSCLKQIEIANRPPPVPKPATEYTFAPHSFYTKIAGVTFPNTDGSSRQQIIQACPPGEELRLVREFDHEFDPDAIRVVRMNGQQLGYLSNRVASGDQSMGLSGLADKIDKGTVFRCRISDITGGGPGMNYGVNIEISDGDFTSDIEPRRDIEQARLQPHPGWNWTGILLVLICAIVLTVLLVIAKAQ